MRTAGQPLRDGALKISGSLSLAHD